MINPNLPAAGLATLCRQADVRALVLEDQEQVDKVADVQTRLPDLRRIWVIDPKGTGLYRHIDVKPLAGLGEGLAAVEFGDDAVAAVTLFSAGIFSEARCVDVSHDALMPLAASIGPLGLHEGERCISLFALSDPLGHFFSVIAPVLGGTVACFGEDRLPSVGEMRQCAPQTVAIPARLLDRLRRASEARATRTGGLRRALLERWTAGDGRGALLKLLVGKPLANALGLGACRTVMTGYEPMGKISADFVRRLGIETRGLFALAEAGGPVASFEQADDTTLTLFESCPATVEVGGELTLRVGGQVLRTGDLVRVNDGRLHLLGRAADLLTLADGQVIAPSLVEAELTASPYVNQAVAVGGPASGLTALVELDETTLRDWARDRGLAFTTLRSFAEAAEVKALVKEAVEQSNRRLPRAARIVTAVLLPRGLEIANGELTPSMALRRSIVRNRYAHRLVAGAAT